ncbi:MULTISPECIES: hypothetical protein [Oceanobacillus]|uniref:hypothetical protein n=1 Tax=Oceanobacillus TaxID=182709 RepID=UPI001868656E|nr:hypothetical protein [Oceanobacillus oncorhynchi]
MIKKNQNTAWSLNHRCPRQSDVRCGKSLSAGNASVSSEENRFLRGISATMLVSVPAGLPISKSSLKEMSSGPMESVVFFRSGYIQLFLYTFLFFEKNNIHDQIDLFFILPIDSFLQLPKSCLLR